MSNEAKTKSLLRAAIGTMVERPLPLIKRLELLATSEGLASPNLDEVVGILAGLTPNDPASLELAQRLRAWDHIEAAEWTAGSDPNTHERRHVVNEELAVYGPMREALDRLIPPYVTAGPVVITAAEVEPWYDYGSALGGFYWKEYVRYLTTTKRWTNVDDLDRSTFNIVANLTDPTQDARYQAKGLVVGHVQSGKTANFTGVIARAETQVIGLSLSSPGPRTSCATKLSVASTRSCSVASSSATTMTSTLTGPPLPTMVRCHPRSDRSIGGA